MERFSPRKPEQVVTTIRIPKDVLDRVDRLSAVADISRNEFINQCILYALESMEEKE
ncbi:MAG: ribbon-helix-helix protein, CopG family [Oscillospiraceae bacterium]|nr:ribbon-helix-helix protein, CopG family [Oscillospiraceae bacterium]